MSRTRMLALCLVMGNATTACADVITDWNEKAVAFVTPRMTPPAAQRAVAIVQVAMFDAVNAIEPRYISCSCPLRPRRRRRQRRLPRRVPPCSISFRK